MIFSLTGFQKKIASPFCRHFFGSVEVLPGLQPPALRRISLDEIGGRLGIRRSN